MRANVLALLGMATMHLLFLPINLLTPAAGIGSPDISERGITAYSLTTSSFCQLSSDLLTTYFLEYIYFTVGDEQ